MNAKQNYRIKAVLFDMDGVLLESETYINRAGVALFREKGYNVYPEDFIEFTGMGEDRYLGGVAEKYGIPFSAERDKARAYEIYAKLVHNAVEPLPGVYEFLHKCREKKLKTALATSADLVKLQINLREIRIPVSTFDATVNGLEISNKKPEPDIFLLAAKKLAVDPSECLVIEDAVSGVRAGMTAGAKVLGLTTTFSAEELHEATWIASDLSVAPHEVLEW